jgi:2',3'-cyclic-nucleotide 2'-phosphodiesterase (5'-nucleotidase family)
VDWGQPVLVVGSGSFGKYISQLDLEFDQYGVITAWVHSPSASELRPNVTIPHSRGSLNGLLFNDQGNDAHILTTSYAEAASVEVRTRCAFALLILL